MELPKRKKNRLTGYDYSLPGAYFVTICTQNRQQLLSHIVGGDVLDGPYIALTKYGKIARKYIDQMNEFYEHVSVDRYVIMPNHIHMMILVLDDGPSGTPVPTRQNSTLSRFVSTFKRLCNKEYGENIWQMRFHDHIIRNRADYEEHLKYICQNPASWQTDELYQPEA